MRPDPRQGLPGEPGAEGPPALREAVGFEVSSLLVPRPSGVAVYGKGLLGALAALRPDRQHLQLYRLSRARFRRHLPRPELPACPFLSGARLHRRVGLLHALDTRLPRAFRGPLVATLFDVISALPLAADLRLSSARFQARKRRHYRRIAERADAAVAISRETRERFLSLFRPRGPVVVVPPGVDEEFFGLEDARRGPPPLLERGIAGPYVLWVGALCPRKNLPGALRAFQAARAAVPGLVLAVVGEGTLAGVGEGGVGPAPAGIEAEGVRCLGYLERRELARAYAGASAVLYLSHYEGFGLPVLEAMAAGAPVVASSRGGIPEAAGEAALLVEPDRPQDAAALLVRLLREPSFAGRLSALGRSRAACFRWELAARAVEELYRQVRQGAITKSRPLPVP